MAQRSTSAFKSTKNSRYADNTSGSITAGNSRDMFEDTADSFLNISDHFIDEDSFASDSATKVPSQQSVKAYVDAQVAGVGAQYTEVSVSSADILSLHTTPKVIVPAPGADKMIKILHGVIVYTFGSTQYTSVSGNLIGAYHGDGSHNAMSIPVSIMTQTESVMAPVASATTVIPFLEGEDASVSIIASAQLSGGDGTVVFKVWYEIIDLV